MSRDYCDLKNSAIQTIKNDALAVELVTNAIDDKFVEAVRMLCGCEGKVLITGSGTSATVGMRGAHLFSVAGTPSFFLSPSDGLHGGLGVLRKSDVMIAISKGGSSSELNEFCKRGKNLAGGLIVLTSSRDSELARLADIVLFIPTHDESDLGSVIATGSSLAAGALLDALVESCRISRSYGWESFFYTHPSGAVGANADETLKTLKG